MEFKITVTFTIENINKGNGLFYLKCLLDYLKLPNSFLQIKDYEIID
jgi:hypothetical protein